VGRALFNDTVGTDDDNGYFSFTIRYNAEEDMELKEHRDASVVTLNINLNLPEESYDGSSLYLLDEEDIGSDGTGTRHFVEFEAGMLLIHRGSVRHAALPISSGSRQNLIIWLFGEDGRVRVAPYNEMDRLTVEQRWGKDTKNNDDDDDDDDDDMWKPEL
jgi:predicted 2-oxoglutarate/Fe(II)-dependent dioxygenase YbiX